MTDLAADLARVVGLLDSIEGCGDGGCFIRRPTGMHTNSGCKCHRDAMKMQRLARPAIDFLRQHGAAIATLEGEGK